MNKSIFLALIILSFLVSCNNKQSYYYDYCNDVLNNDDSNFIYTLNLLKTDSFFKTAIRYSKLYMDNNKDIEVYIYDTSNTLIDIHLDERQISDLINNNIGNFGFSKININNLKSYIKFAINYDIYEINNFWLSKKLNDSLNYIEIKFEPNISIINFKNPKAFINNFFREEYVNHDIILLKGAYYFYFNKHANRGFYLPFL